MSVAGTCGLVIENRGSPSWRPAAAVRDGRPRH
jgi:hypothetical protein